MLHRRGVRIKIGQWRRVGTLGSGERVTHVLRPVDLRKFGVVLEVRRHPDDRGDGPQLGMFQILRDLGLGVEMEDVMKRHRHGPRVGKAAPQEAFECVRCSRNGSLNDVDPLFDLDIDVQ